MIFREYERPSPHPKAFPVYGEGGSAQAETEEAFAAQRRHSKFEITQKVRISPCLQLRKKGHRTLSLVLVVAMVMSFMLSASAATAEQLADL
ncbi:MAG: hypothetical protein IKL99_00325, partial [Oscillospiraceae bacterium]|nr:hypothetical protein [Oscillospiraceae bacterium]